MEIAEIVIEAAAVGRSRQKDIDEAVAIVVAHRHAAAGGVIAQLTRPLGPLVHKVDADFLGVERFEQLLIWTGMSHS